MPEVRCVDEAGNQIGILPTREALIRAQAEGLDLVEISPNASPPVCRIMDFGKFKYEQGKKDRQTKRHHAASKVKEVQFHQNVGTHDYQTKIRHTHEFLAEGHRVKVCLFFRGRENTYREFGFEIMNRVIHDCQDAGVAEQPPRLMGRNIQMLLCPRPGLKVKPKAEADGLEAAAQPAKA